MCVNIKGTGETIVDAQTWLNRRILHIHLSFFLHVATHLIYKYVYNIPGSNKSETVTVYDK